MQLARGIRDLGVLGFLFFCVGVNADWADESNVFTADSRGRLRRRTVAAVQHTSALKSKHQIGSLPTASSERSFLGVDDQTESSPSTPRSGGCCRGVRARVRNLFRRVFRPARHRVVTGLRLSLNGLQHRMEGLAIQNGVAATALNDLKTVLQNSPNTPCDNPLFAKQHGEAESALAKARNAKFLVNDKRSILIDHMAGTLGQKGGTVAALMAQAKEQLDRSYQLSQDTDSLVTQFCALCPRSSLCEIVRDGGRGL